MEHGRLKTRWIITKWRDPDHEVERLLKAGACELDVLERYPGRHLGTQVVNDNCLLNEGIQHLWDIVTGVAGSLTLWNSSNARVGVGDSNTVAAASQTDLQALVNKAYASMDATYPSRSSQTVSWRGTFGDGVAQYAWEEFVVDNGAASGKTLNRKVESKGTKNAGESWSLTVQITLS